MSGQMCQQCGFRPASGGGELCFECFARALDVQDRQVRGANAQIEMAEAQRQDAEEREEERRRERRRQRAAAINDLPNQVERSLATATTDDRLIGAIAEIAQACAAIDERAWLLLNKMTSMQAEVTYTRLRNLLVPRLAEWWKRRDRLTPSPVPMLKVIAKSIRYTTFSSISAARSSLDTELARAQTELDGANVEAERVRGELVEATAASSAAISRASEAQEKVRQAREATGTPIDPAQVEDELTSYVPPVVAFVAAGIALAIAIAAVVGKQPIFSLCCGFTTLAFAVMGGQLLVQRIRNRALSKEAFKALLASTIREKISEQQAALTKAEADLSARLAEQATALAAGKTAQDRLAASEVRAAQLQQRLAALPDELMRRYTDPSLLPILQE